MAVIEEVPEFVERVHSLIEAEDSEGLTQILSDLSHSDTALLVSRMEERDRCKLLTLLEPANAAYLLEELVSSQACEILTDLEPSQAAGIVTELPPDEQADLLGEVREDDAEAILGAMEPGEAERTRRLMAYPSDSAGGLMKPEFLAFPKSMTAGELISELRTNQEKYADYSVQYVYITDDEGRLRGVLRLRDLLLARSSRPIGDLMIPEPLSVNVNAELSELADFFDTHRFLGVPVVNDKEIIVGMLQKSAVDEAMEHQAEDTFLKSSGIIGGEELRSMPLLHRCVRRLSWLAPNIVLNLIAASVIAMYQDTLEAVIALAVFLPIVSDMSGCSGNQAVAVSIRELTMGLIRPKEMWRVFTKEFGVGILNGIVLGTLLGSVAGFWQGNAWLGLVVGGALATNTIVSVLLGGLVPLILRRFKVDPALASGPILTTVTDMCGFFLVLNLASLVLARLM